MAGYTVNPFHAIHADQKMCCHIESELSLLLETAGQPEATTLCCVDYEPVCRPACQDAQKSL